jgi:hypothetical protein
MSRFRYVQGTCRKGDFNNDGQMDLLWWNKTDGNIAVWTMIGTAKKAKKGY